MKHSFICLGELIHSLKVAYVASCKALALANKLKSKKHRQRVMSTMNYIRIELVEYEAMASTGGLFDCIKYTGVITPVILGKLPEYFKDWTMKKYKITYLWKSVTLEAISESKALQKAKELLGLTDKECSNSLIEEA